MDMHKVLGDLVSVQTDLYLKRNAALFKLLHTHMFLYSIVFVYLHVFLWLSVFHRDQGSRFGYMNKLT